MVTEAQRVAYERMMVRCEPFPDGHGLRFTGATDSHGYGVVRVGPKFIGAHRLAYGVRTGQWPAQVMHACDRPACVAERCLIPGNATLNQLDSAAKGRARRRPIRGAANPNARLRPGQVRVIRRRAARGVSASVLARAFGVSRETIRLVVRHDRYREVI